jgi:uncharacterized membrane protein HdeD (DUF308 family)
MTLKQLLGIVLAITGVIFLLVGLRQEDGLVQVVIGVVVLLLGVLAVLIKPPRRR